MLAQQPCDTNLIYVPSELHIPHNLWESTELKPLCNQRFSNASRLRDRGWLVSVHTCGQNPRRELRRRADEAGGVGLARTDAVGTEHDLLARVHRLDRQPLRRNQLLRAERHETNSSPAFSLV